MNIISFDNSKRAIAKNATLGFAFQFIIKFKGIIILPLIVHFLQKETLGEWRIITTSLSILLPVISLNLLDGSGMFFSSDTDKIRVRTKYYSLFNLICLLLIVCFICFSIIRIFYFPTCNILIFIFSYFAASVLYKLTIFLFQTYQKSSYLLKINFIIEYGGVIFMLLLIYCGIRDLLTLILPIILFYIFTSFYLFYQINKEIKYSFKIDWSFIRTVLPISIPLIPVFITEWVLSSVGIYFLEIYYSLEIVGSYSVLLSIASLVLTLRATLQFFWFSTCSNMIKIKYQEFLIIFKETIKAYFFFSIIIIIFYGFYSYDIINILANQNYQNIKNALYITVIGYILMVFSTIWNGVLYAVGKSKKISLCYLLSAIAVLLSAWILVPAFGIIGASISYFIGNFILFITMYKFAPLPIRFDKKEKQFNYFSLFLLLLICSIQLFNINFNILRLLGILTTVIILIMAVRLKYFSLSAIINFIKKK